MTGESLIIDAMRAGVLLQAEGDQLRCRAVDRLPPDLAARLRSHKVEVLHVLTSATAAEPTADPAGVGGVPESAQAGDNGDKSALSDAYEGGSVTNVTGIEDLGHEATPETSVDLVDHYHERLAIMVIDGQVPETQARAAAWAETPQGWGSAST